MAQLTKKASTEPHFLRSVRFVALAQTIGFKLDPMLTEIYCLFFLFAIIKILKALAHFPLK